ncbi:MBL fold metallo-hydrolase [Microvirga rosea]|uniref:MBL fold metallo-hydrolase n=1 Tax=Microvirga rosea TaxID=2715425 RepID=UPI001D0BB1A4|nr:MBL fold metallo-hydrolase [Microvirga rosea]MCB8823491.1 MBL fold metallo-hydrolase [Microvirga rosea]
MALPLASAAWATTAAHTIRVGDIAVNVISDGHLEVPVAFQLPRTSGSEVDALFKASGIDAPRQLTSPTNVTLVRTQNELVLIDAGAGSTFQATAGRLADNLEAAGIDRGAITKVVFTHGHADHLWGVIDDFDETERFPNASYVISSTEWDFWTHPDALSRMPEVLHGMARGTQRILKRIESRIERRNSGDTIAPGLTYLGTEGHTPGHMSILIDSHNEHLLIGGDALTHSIVSFARPDWPWGSDLDQDVAAGTRRRLLDQLADSRLPLIGFHLPWPGKGYVERNGTAYRFVSM